MSHVAVDKLWNRAVDKLWNRHIGFVEARLNLRREYFKYFKYLKDKGKHLYADEHWGMIELIGSSTPSVRAVAEYNGSSAKRLGAAYRDFKAWRKGKRGGLSRRSKSGKKVYKK